MANQKLQVGRALDVYPSDYAPIPFPNISAEGTTTSSAPNVFVDSTANFNSDKVSAGDIVYNTTTKQSANVIGLISSTSIELDASIFIGAGEGYKVFKGGFNNGCVLYIGGTGDVNLKTIAGDNVIFRNFQYGQFIPIQVIQVLESDTTATDIVALW